MELSTEQKMTEKLMNQNITCEVMEFSIEFENGLFITCDHPDFEKTKTHIMNNWVILTHPLKYGEYYNTKDYLK